MKDNLLLLHLRHKLWISNKISRQHVQTRKQNVRNISTACRNSLNSVLETSGHCGCFSSSISVLFRYDMWGSHIIQDHCPGCWNIESSGVELPERPRMSSGHLRLSESVAVDSACLLTALVVILRDLRGDCVPHLQGIPVCGFYTVLRSNWCLSSGRDPGFERDACGATPEVV
jgi:hypothetical protein